jgi:serine/threonine protein kinase/Flp pilus assembly protein TadD
MSESLETLFEKALAFESSEDRSAFLDLACAERPEMRLEVESLLNAYSRGDFLEPLTCTLENPQALSTALETPGSTIDRYKLLEQIGEGGMGVVYMAEQINPVRRRVALKIVKPGMDSRQVLARFEAERQALALMDHPNIARVHDAGTGENGRPYFVMELVRGVPITQYCDQARLTTRKRLELFIAVCHAIVHAHQKGIIHRDLKPSNILVTLHDGVPVPKVIDFGIAKAVSQQLTENTLFTAFNQMVGTPLYMSPEQAEMSGLDVDTRSDVYSLGVLLYELLTGQTPFDKEYFAKAGIDEIRRIIREDEPLRPSRRMSTIDAKALSTVSQRRRIDERQLGQILSSELDWIVMKAMEKDRTRRYESVSHLAADVQRYLNDEPVQACPPSAGYRLRKFLRRRRQSVTVAAICACASFVVLGITLAMWYSSWRSNEARSGRIRDSLVAANASLEAGNLDDAERRLDQAKAMLAEETTVAKVTSQLEQVEADVVGRRKDQQELQRFRSLADEGLQDGMGATDLENPEQSAKNALDVFGVLQNDQWPAELQQRHFTATEREEIQETAYTTLLFLADHEVRWNQDAQHAARGQEYLNRAASFHAPTRAFHFVQSRIHRIQGNTAAAETTDALFAGEEATSAWDYFLPGHTAGWEGDLPEAIRSYEAALRIQPNHYQSLYFLAMRLGSQQIHRTAEAIRVYTACMAVRPDDPMPLMNRGHCYHQLGDNQSAEADFNRAIELATTDDQRIYALEGRSKIYLATGQGQKAVEDLEQIVRLGQNRLDAHQARFGPSADETLKAIRELALAYHWLKRDDKAIPLLEQARTESERHLGDRNPNTLTSLHDLAYVLDRDRQYENAQTLYERALEGRRAVLGLRNIETQSTMNNLALSYSSSGRLEEAMSLAQELVDVRRGELGRDNVLTLDSIDLLCSIKSRYGQTDEAIRIREENEASRKKLDARHPLGLKMANNLGNAYNGAGRFADAIGIFEQMLPDQVAASGRDYEDTLVTMFNLSVAYEKMGRLEDAIPLKEEVLARRTAKFGRDHATTMSSIEDLALTYLRVAKMPEKGIPLEREWLALWRNQSTDHAEFAAHQAAWALDMLESGAYAEVEPMLRECLATRTRLAPNDWRTFNTQSMLGGALLGLNRHEEAEPLLLSGYQGLKDRQQQIPPEGAIRLPQAAERLAKFYEAKGDAEKAAHWREMVSRNEEVQ